MILILKSIINLIYYPLHFNLINFIFKVFNKIIKYHQNFKIKI